MTSQDDLLLNAQRVIRGLRDKLASRQQSSHEPVAIVGMACRFPCGSEDVDAFWRTTLAGVSAVRDLPAGRWDVSFYPGALSSFDRSGHARFRACFLEQPFAFDADFFGISSREAMQMEPPQRLFLEVAWHALEDAGQTKRSLAGSDTAVFAGNTGVGEFLAQHLSASADIDIYTGTGTGPDVIAGRLAYFLDLRGPCATINTACSSSLVALHLARRSLLAGECSMAIAGGVNVLGPVSTAMASRMDFLAADGCSKPFEEHADGFGRGEGCGIVILKRLSDAIASHDRVLAVIHGSAMNQDGRTNGLTAPNGRSQAALLRRALKDSGLEASQLGYVEAHGTGTPLGDPIEVEAIAEVLGNGSSPCGLGSAKGNIGHLEGAAGIAGVIRTVLILRNGIIPPVANFRTLNPHISLAGTRLFVPSTPRPWSRSTEARYAGVSSFGWSGTNAHVLLGEPPAPANRLEKADVVREVIVPLSASDPISLSLLARAMADALAKQHDDDLPAFAWSAGARRSHHAHRLAVAGADSRSIAAKLLERTASTLQDPPTSPPSISISFAREVIDDARIIIEMLAHETIFKDAVERCDREITAAGIPDPLIGPAAAGRELAGKLGTFVLQFGITELLKSWGVRASTARGEGVGAILAALTNGAIDLKQAVAQMLSGQNLVPAHTQPLHGNLGRTVGLVLGHPGPRQGLPNEEKIIHLLPRGLSARRSLLEAVAALYEEGVEIEWDAVSGSDRRLLPLPTYPFRHEDASVFTSTATEAPEEWFYETTWPEMPIAIRAPQRQQTRPAKWIIVPDRAGFGERLVQAATRSGDEAVLIRPKKALQEAAISDQEAERLLDRAMTTFNQDESVIVVHLVALDLADLDLSCEIESQARFEKHWQSKLDAAIDTLMGLVHLCRTLEKKTASRNIKVWVVTRGGQRLPREVAPLSLVQSTLWGLCASAALEHPDLWGGIVDLDPRSPSDEATRLIEHLVARDNESRALFREGRRHVARLRQAPPPPPTQVKINPDATYLITGAFGGIGLELAEWLVQSGAKHLVLLGRRPSLQTTATNESEAAPHDAIERLKASGVAIQRVACDVAGFDQMSALFSRFNASGHPIRGILHAAADVIWKPLLELDQAGLLASFQAKARGSLVLHELSRNQPLDFLAFFSSAAVSVGAREASAYAAANAFMDSLALRQSDMGLPARSMQWGNWQRRQAHGNIGQQQFVRSGFPPMPPDRAVNALGRVLARNTPPAPGNQVMVAHIDRSMLKAATAMRGQSLFLSELEANRPIVQAANASPLVTPLSSMPGAQRMEALTDLITARVRHTLGWTVRHPVDRTRGFFDMGFDSLKSIELKNALAQATGLSLSSTLVMTYPNVNALAGYLHALLFGEEAEKSLAQAIREPDHSSASLTDAQTHDALAAELELLRGRFDV